MLRFLALAAFISLATADYGPWADVVDGKCSADCGMQGTKIVAERKCLADPCFGGAYRYEECGEGLCPYPKRTCSSGYIRGIINRKFQCIVIDIANPPKRTIFLE